MVQEYEYVIHKRADHIGHQTSLYISSLRSSPSVACPRAHSLEALGWMERVQKQWLGSWIIFFLTQTTVTVVGSFPPRRSDWECVVKNPDTGRQLCKGRSPPDKICTCSIPTRATYKGKQILHCFLVWKWGRRKDLPSSDGSWSELKVRESV